MNEQRPRQVTVAGWLIMLGGIAVVVTAYQQMAALHSLATRESVEKVLTEPPFDGSGLGVGQVLGTLHVLALIAAACATASVVLGWHALKRSRSARIVLSVLAVPLLLAGIGGGGLFSTVVAVSALLLWLPPAKQWFRGEPLPGDPAARGRADAPGGSAASPPSHPPAQPPVRQPTGQHPPAPPRPLDPPRPPGPQAPVPPSIPPSPPSPGHHVPPPAGWPPPSAWPPPAWPAGRVSVPATTRPQHRPGSIVTAAVLTWVFSAIAVVVMVGTLCYALNDRDGVWHAALQQNPDLASEGVTRGDFIGLLAAMVGLTAIWCIATAVIAIFVWRGAPWARVTLVVLVAISLGVLVMACVVTLVCLVPAAAAAGTIMLLARPESRAWCQPPA